MKKIIVYFMSIIIIFSSIKIPSFAAGSAVAAGLGEFLKSLGYSIVWSVGSDIADDVIDNFESWVTNDKKYYDSHESDQGNQFGGGGNNRSPKYYDGNEPISDAMQDFYRNDSIPSNQQFIDNSVTNKYTYSSYSSTVTDARTYSLIKDSFNTTNNYLLYNPITNNYTEVNNISYNNQFDTYYITNNEYNYYITNNYTYYSYYIINNETGEDTYCEVFYEMPDGRNSYDLEVSDVWGEYFIYDVVGYESLKEDDGKTLALYHLDDSLTDSSYWQHSSLSGGSGVYSSGKFDNAYLASYKSNVYLDLPYNFDYNNFTLEFTMIVTDSFATNVFVKNKKGFIPYEDAKYSIYWHSLGPCSGPGIYSVVLQCDNGSWSGYVNGKEGLTASYNYYQDDYKVCSIELTEDSIIFGGNASCNNSNQKYFLDEVRLSSCPLYSGDVISVMNQEFDTNQVLCLPENPYESLIAVQGSQDVSGYRIGGVRPTYPTNGYVYIYLEDDVVKDIQQFQNDGWYSINGCIYLDGKWNELKEYNLSSLTFDEDDNNSGGSDDSGGSGSDGSDGSGGSGSGGSVSDNDTGSGLSGFLSGIGSIGDAILSIFGKLLEYIGKALELLSGTVTKVLDLVPGNITALLVALFPFIPQEWITIIELSLVLGLILGIVGLLKK